MTIDIPQGVLITAVIAYFGQVIGFIIWVKIEIRLLKQSQSNMNNEKVKEDARIEKENNRIEGMIKSLAEKVDRFSESTNTQLYDLNTKVTTASVLAAVIDKKTQ